MSSKSYHVLFKQIPRRFLAPSTKKAFLFAYLYVVLPKVIKNLVTSISKKDPITYNQQSLKTLWRAMHPNKFPCLIARMIGVSNALIPIMIKLTKNKVTGSLIGSFLGAILSFPSFQHHVISRNRFYSLDLTLIMFTRALDTASTALFPLLFKNANVSSLNNLGDGMLFVLSSFLIMHNWFYYPSKLPPAYHRWITSAANVDSEIIQYFVAVKNGTIKYGGKDSTNRITDEFAAKYGHSAKEVVDYTKEIRAPCKMLHCFKTDSCEFNCLWRFGRGFKFAFKLYATINLMVFLIRKKGGLNLMVNTLRSSTFLATFIGLYWYGLCTARRILPHLFPNVPETRWEDTIVPACGAASCGFSCFVENAQRRKELSLFVAPRALGTLVPSEPTSTNLLIEKLAFSLSFMVLVSYAKQDPKKVRGIMGKGLKAIFND